MARCTKQLFSQILNKVVLVCNLDEQHETVFPKHWDKTLAVYWQNAPVNPTPVTSTRTTNVPQNRAAVNSASVHTKAFEVVK